MATKAVGIPATPLSTLKLNARILRELNLISYGSPDRGKDAELRDLKGPRRQVAEGGAGVGGDPVLGLGESVEFSPEGAAVYLA